MKLIKLRVEHKPTKSMKPKKGVYTRERVTVEDALFEIEQEQADAVGNHEFGGDTGIDADFYYLQGFHHEMEE